MHGENFCKRGQKQKNIFSIKYINQISRSEYEHYIIDGFICFLLFVEMVEREELMNEQTQIPYEQQRYVGSQFLLSKI